ncbi:MAG: hypothetical protein ETSY1_32255 [Candidatus Entotheonella factor]|uniref:UspA domain-containing protein n=1 Tax=Entotheonella factor TaxID=1429438 RepID=W4LAL8_ENTF1|nr:MAG: hypothetical protein ETSY1_32255 [Candidatus Entotheonella factor]
MNTPDTVILPISFIFHLSDFTHASEVAFMHALKLGLITEAALSIMHITSDSADAGWLDFPAVRLTLERWGILPEGSKRSDVADTGLQVQKVLAEGRDPADAVLNYLAQEPADLVVLATHQHDGMARWLHRAVAEPIARRSKTMTLFIPHRSNGFVAPEDGRITLQHVLLPVDRVPPPQDAIDIAADLTRAFGVEQVAFTLLYIGAEGDQPMMQLPQRDGWTWNTVVRQGHVVEQILEVAAHCAADLIVMTTQGHQGFLDALRGSTSERVVRGGSLSSSCGTGGLSGLMDDLFLDFDDA